MRYSPSSAFCLSPWYGVLEIVGEPSNYCTWGTECWNGDHVGAYVTETLRPLTPLAAKILGRKPEDKVWDRRRVKLWENEPIRWR